VLQSRHHFVKAGAGNKMMRLRNHSNRLKNLCLYTEEIDRIGSVPHDKNTDALISPENAKNYLFLSE
jgi:hypothetical protein